MTGSEIRAAFIDFFRRRGHEVLRSAPLVPEKDPTLLFTNAGMVQFKNVFVGTETRGMSRAVNAQKCLRLSGKHNDLEEVGRDTYHHTFFEMLGNWSFGDYYKREAIAWAWELLTREWNLPKGSLFATVFRTDDEAERCWRTETDIRPDHILRFGEKDNFWEMGEVGPCGPCSEIHIDRGPQACDRGAVPGHVCGVNGNCARFIELWNLVFIQYNRTARGVLEPLPARHVDTGAGLERLAAILQGVRSDYDTDLFRDLIRFTGERAGKRYGTSVDDDLSFRVIADHARALTFLIADGVLPSNDGRGYVLRRVLRRAARHARQLGLDEPFLWRLSQTVVEVMGDAYPEIVDRRAQIAQVIRAEEERFGETLDKGLTLLEQEKALLRKRGVRVLPGAVAFRLYDTFGFPLDLTEDILRADGFQVDAAGFETAMEAQRQRARDGRKAAAEVVARHGAYASRFVGDRVYEGEAPVTALLVDGEERAEVEAGESVQVIVPETPFYGEAGGQVGDRGVIEAAGGVRVEVVDARKPRPELTVHVGRVIRGSLAKGSCVRLRVDRSRREAARRNHSATHILHSVLREHLGPEVRQAGSLVEPGRLRFDFTYTGPVSAEAMWEIEEDANARIRENTAVQIEEMAFDEAIEAGALAFFGDKYGARVRVVRIGDYSAELCGGTHVARAGDIGLLKLRSESGVAAGVRRIEAVSGEGALEWVRSREQVLRQVGALLRGPDDEVAARLERVLAQERALERQLKQLQDKLAGSQSDGLLKQARQVDGLTVLAAEVEGVDDRGLRELADRLRTQIRSGVVVLGTTRGERALLLAAVTRDLIPKYHAGHIIKRLAPLIGGGGGGKPELAQAGGKEPARLREALEVVYQLVS
ncbi:MAG: alanine--tRNA ligase [Candidatus Binatia bacterium]